MKILKDMPTYDPKSDAFHNADVFESYADRFNLIDEQRNHIYNLWLPNHISRRIKKSPYINDQGQEIHCDAADRLKQLLLCTTADDTPSIDLLDSLKVTINDDPYEFAIKFTKAYALVMNVEADDSGLLKAFVKKFRYLDPTSLTIALEKGNIEDVCSFIDKIRRQLKLTNIKSKIAVIHNDKIREHRVKFNPEAVVTRGKFDKKQQLKQREPVICYYCKEAGHLKWQCKKFLRDVQQKNLGKENGIVHREPTAPPLPNDKKSFSPYAPLTKIVKELTVKYGADATNMHSITEDSEGLLPKP